MLVCFACWWFFKRRVLLCGRIVGYPVTTRKHLDFCMASLGRPYRSWTQLICPGKHKTLQPIKSTNQQIDLSTRLDLSRTEWLVTWPINQLSATNCQVAWLVDELIQFMSWFLSVPTGRSNKLAARARAQDRPSSLGQMAWNRQESEHSAAQRCPESQGGMGGVNRMSDLCPAFWVQRSRPD